MKFFNRCLMALMTLGIVSVAQAKLYSTPTERVPKNEWPKFEDDLDFENMSLGVQRQIVRFKQKSANTKVQLGATVYTVKEIMDSLELIKDIGERYSQCNRLTQNQFVMSCSAWLNQKIKENFNLYRPLLNPDDKNYGEDRPSVFTGYYTPLYEAKKSRQGQFRYGIYAKPKNENLRRKTRVEILFEDALEGTGHELFYIEDLFDVYILQVEGGGKVVVDNNGKKQYYYLSYDGSNGRSFDFISKYMIKMGYINNPSNPSQHEFLKNNPEKEREIYEFCPNYVYFKVSDQPPIGSDNVSLTDNRSIATDRRYYKFKGLLSYVETQRPKPQAEQNIDSFIHLTEEEWRENMKYKSFGRFMLDQDTGGAIRGKARVDLYYGEGEYAQFAAENTYTRGKLYFLAPKK